MGFFYFIFTIVVGCENSCSFLWSLLFCAQRKGKTLKTKGKSKNVPLNSNELRMKSCDVICPLKVLFKKRN